jgi:hypothetical protein
MKRVTLTRPVRSGASYVKPSEQGTTTPPSPLPFRGEEGEGVPPRRQNEMKKEKTEHISLDDLINSLTASERKEMLAKLALAAQPTSVDGQIRDTDMWAQAVYEALVASQAVGGGGLPGPMLVKRILSGSGSWTSVAGFMKVSKMDTLKVTERQSVYMMLAKLVVDQATYVSREQHIPMSTKLVANCAVNVGGLFEQSFPGYLGSGLALIVARRLTGH